MVPSDMWVPFEDTQWHLAVQVLKSVSVYQVCLCVVVLLTVCFDFSPKSLNSTSVAYFKGPVGHVSLSELFRCCWLWQGGFGAGPVFLISLLEGQNTVPLFRSTPALLEQLQVSSWISLFNYFKLTSCLNKCLVVWVKKLETFLKGCYSLHLWALIRDTIYTNVWMRYSSKCLWTHNASSFLVSLMREHLSQQPSGTSGVNMMLA